MNRKLGIIFSVVWVLVLINDIFLFQELNIYIPIIFLTLIILTCYTLILTRSKIKKGEFFEIGRKKNPIFHSLFSIGLGISLIILGIVSKHSAFCWSDIHLFCFLGFLYLFNAAFVYVSHGIIFKKDSIAFYNMMVEEQCRYSKIDKIVIDKSQVIFHYKNKMRKYMLEDEDIQKLKSNLPTQLQSKFEIVE